MLIIEFQENINYKSRDLSGEFKAGRTWCSPEWFLVRAHTSHRSLAPAKKIMTSDLWLNRTQEEGGIK